MNTDQILYEIKERKRLGRGNLAKISASTGIPDKWLYKLADDKIDTNQPRRFEVLEKYLNENPISSEKSNIQQRPHDE